MSIVYADSLSRPVASSGPHAELRSIWLESFDRKVVVPFDDAPFTLLPEVTGLGVGPVDVVTSSTPGVDGGFVEEIRGVSRPVLLPLEVGGAGWSSRRVAIRRLQEVCQVGQFVTHSGGFQVVGASPLGVRQMDLVYLSGLEGDEALPGVDRIPLAALAVDPFARDREVRSVEFSLGVSTGVMVSSDPAGAGPRQLGSSVVIGDNMPVDIVSGIPVWPRIDVTGPFDPLTVEANTGMNISMPDGVPAGSTFTAILDPRNRSFRLNGALAAGMIARGSRVGRPFLPGLNFLSVSASGADEDSRIVLSWRGGWRSLW